MTQGVVIFATGDDIDYARIAKEAARRVEHFLALPVTVLSGDTSSHGIRFWQDSGQQTRWYNSGRCRVWDLSPYDTTIMIDADYWLHSDRLKTLMHSDQDFQCHLRALEIPRPGVVAEKTFGNLHQPMAWATVVKFRRTRFSQDVFECWNMIEQNYGHYAQLFNFSPSPFRNDYALSLALLMCNGHVMPNQVDIPWPLINVLPEARIDNEQGIWKISWQALQDREMRNFRIAVKDQDLHLMGKSQLGDHCGLPI